MILAFKDAAYSRAADTPNKYYLQLNPDTYQHRHAASYRSEGATEGAGTPVKFLALDPETLSFEFYLDASGALPLNSNKSTSEDDPPNTTPMTLAKAIEEFKKVVYDYKGEIHAPSYLKIIWADTVFKCRLTSLNIEYTLFKPSGAPLRAKIDVAFEQHLSPDELARRALKSSPDLTHLRMVHAGDTLPVMCFRIYGDSRHYPRVAWHNGLHDFRRLEPGTTLLFPPLERA
jgi:hypothetical protein